MTTKKIDDSKRPVANTLRRIYIYRGLASPMAITSAMLKMGDPGLRETLRMQKEALYAEELK